jgi:hypothetical protein
MNPFSSMRVETNPVHPRFGNDVTFVEDALGLVSCRLSRCSGACVDELVALPGALESDALRATVTESNRRFLEELSSDFERRPDAEMVR